MDKSFYRDKLVMQDHLNGNDYKETAINQDELVMKNIKTFVKKYKDILTSKEQDFITNFAWKSSNFYVLPKIHKSKEIINTITKSNDEYIEMSPPHNLKGRPIVAGPVSPTQRLSEFLDTLLKPFVSTLSTYVKDDWDFLRKLPYEPLEKESRLYSYDVVSLYTNIPHALGLEAIAYWINARPDLVPDRFPASFILEAAKIVLTNNNFMFNDRMFTQISGTAMGTKFAPPYACLTMGYLEEAILFPKILRKYFDENLCLYIQNNYLRYMDDGFIILPVNINAEQFKTALNELHPAITFTMEEGKLSKNTESLNFLDVEVILSNGTQVTTDIFYKDTNPHDYLNFQSAHPRHIKDTIPYNLAKRIVVFVTDEERIKFRLQELKNWLLNCNYPNSLIEHAFHKAKLQGPAPNKKRDFIPLVTTFYPSLNHSHVIKTISNLFKGIQDPETKRKFNGTKPILALKQPPNLTSILTNAKFTSISSIEKPEPGIKLCNKVQCKLCRLYLQPVKSFKTANGTTWDIKLEITCNSKNVVYFLSCNLCHGQMNYIGQTTNLRQRMNNHISESRSGVSSCNFPKHVHNCGKSNKNLTEPFFKIYVFMTLHDPKSLLEYESKLFNKGHAIMN